MAATLQSGHTHTESSSSQPPPPPPPSATTLDSSNSDPSISSYPAPPSPVRPPVSPLTPHGTFAQLAIPLPASGLPPLDSNAPSNTQAHSQSRAQPVKAQAPPPKPTFISAPNTVPFEESDNTDAAALRAAIAVLQIQKEKSRQDIKTLQRLRQGLIKDPDAFTQELLSGRLREEKSPNDPLHATFTSTELEDSDDDDDDNDDDNNNDPDTDNNDNDNSNNHNSGDSDIPDADETSHAKATGESPTQYPPIPTAQNVIRCPPINWAKYHIAGEPLDRMHEEQRRRPTAGEPIRDTSLQQQKLQQLQQPAVYNPILAEEHQVFASYEPWRDKHTAAADQLGLTNQARRVPKKPETTPSTLF